MNNKLHTVYLPPKKQIYRTCLLNSSSGILLTGVALKGGFGAVTFTYAVMVGWGIGSSYGLLMAAAASVSK